MKKKNNFLFKKGDRVFVCHWLYFLNITGTVIIANKPVQPLTENSYIIHLDNEVEILVNEIRDSRVTLNFGESSLALIPARNS